VAFDRLGAFGLEVAPMMASIAWALVRDDPTRKASDVDRYVRREYGGPNAAWLLSEDVLPKPSVEPTHEDGVSESVFRRITQAIAAFL